MARYKYILNIEKESSLPVPAVEPYPNPNILSPCPVPCHGSSKDSSAQSGIQLSSLLEKKKQWTDGRTTAVRLTASGAQAGSPVLVWLGGVCCPGSKGQTGMDPGKLGPYSVKQIARDRS